MMSRGSSRRLIGLPTIFSGASVVATMRVLLSRFAKPILQGRAVAA
jgi:hypothetical protein